MNTFFGSNLNDINNDDIFKIIYPLETKYFQNKLALLMPIKTLVTNIDHHQVIQVLAIVTVKFMVYGIVTAK